MSYDERLKNLFHPPVSTTRAVVHTEVPHTPSRPHFSDNVEIAPDTFEVRGRETKAGTRTGSPYVRSNREFDF